MYDKVSNLEAELSSIKKELEEAKLEADTQRAFAKDAYAQMRTAKREVERVSKKLNKKIVLLGLLEGYVLAGSWEDVKGLVADDIAERQAFLVAALTPPPTEKGD